MTKLQEPERKKIPPKERHHGIMSWLVQQRVFFYNLDFYLLTYGREQQQHKLRFLRYENVEARLV